MPQPARLYEVQFLKDDSMDRFSTLLIWASALGALLIAGVFFAFSNFIMPAFARISASQGMPVMQSINITVLNPLFLSIFAGTAVLAGILAAMAVFGGASAGSLRIIAAALFYIIGCFGVTMVLNVPLNDALAKADALSAEGAAFWADFLKSWTFWNSVRTLASLAAGALLISAL
jgi:uncharacterized membrane protein